MKPFVIIFSLLVSLISSILVIENNCLINRDCRSLRLFLTFLSPCMHMYIDKTWQPSTMRLATLVRCLFALFPPSPMRFTRWTIGMKFAARRRISNPHRYPNASYAFPSIFPGNICPAVSKRNETDPVRGNADCSRCVRETFWEDRFGGKWNFRGERKEKLRSSGKELILSLLFRYFTTGAQNVQFVIMIRKWATVGGCRYSVMRYYHAFGKIWRSLENMYFVTRPF